MDYPKEIIPSSRHKLPFPLKALVEKEGAYEVCYRIIGGVKENALSDTLGGKTVLREECFEHIVHMSINLMGGPFKPEYVCFSQKKPGSDEWKGGDVCFNDYAASIELLKDAVPIFYLSDILNQPELSVTVQFENSDSYKSFKKTMGGEWPVFFKGIKVAVPFSLRIEHVPTNLNYWHVQMEVYPKMTEEQLKTESGVWRSRIFDNIKTAILCHHFTDKAQLDYVISEDMYLVGTD